MAETRVTPPRSIAKDLTIGLILVVLVVSSFALLTTHYTSRTEAEAELEAKADEYTAFIKDTLVLPLWNYDFETIKAVCRTYLQNELITGIEVRDVRRQVDVAMVKENARPTLVRTVDLAYHDLPLGRVRISLTDGYLRQQNRRLFWSFALVTLSNLAALAVLTGIMLRMSLKRPLDRLNRIVEAYAAGDYRSPAPEETHAELQPLVDTLDQMGRRIENQLTTIRRAEHKYRSIFENAIEGIYQTTADGRILSANPAFARILGYDGPDELMAAIDDIAIQHWVNPADRREMVRQVVAGTATAFETRLVRRDGQVIAVLINGRPVYDGDGNLRHLEGMVQDVTDKVRFEEQVRQTQKLEAIGTLAGGIAHDFNNMLGVIIGCTELALDAVPGGGKAAADMERVLDAGLRAKALVRQILTFSRQSASEFKPLMLRPFLKEVVKFLRSTLPANVELRLSGADRDLTVLADPTQLQQVLLNLCTNSAHALAPDGGRIEVSLTERAVAAQEPGPAAELAPGAYVALAVRDDGPGIDPGHLHRVFDPFFTTKGVGEGTGLGLSVVHGIVQNHGGVVWAESEPGRGTVMRVLLPSLAHPGFEPASESTVVPPEGTERILLVEDEPVLADILDRILGGLGYTVAAFTDGEEAWRSFAERPDAFDLVLIDHNMPGATGIEIAGRIHGRRPELPVILFTGMSIEPLREAAAAAGVRSVINKPLNRIELALAIREVLDERH